MREAMAFKAAEQESDGYDSEELGSSMDVESAYDINVEEFIEDEFTGLGETVYALATASFIRDYVWLQQGTNAGYLRAARIGFSLLNITGCLFLQIFLLNAVYDLLCNTAVHKIREDYSHYQLVMYGRNHAKLNENGFYRGDSPEFLDFSKFDTLSHDEKHSVCQIPLAHPKYTFAILLIWTFTCISDVRKTVGEMNALLRVTPTVSDTNQVLKSADGKGIAAEVVGLTLPMKLVIALLIEVPRLFAVGILAFLGCRWLMATNSLSDILLNGLALEFMLVLKELLYHTLASKRNMTITENTLIHGEPVGKLSCSSMLGSTMWALLAISWVYLYIFHIQTVLPEYKWDVKEVCAGWKGSLSTG